MEMVETKEENGCFRLAQNSSRMPPKFGERQTPRLILRSPSRVGWYLKMKLKSLSPILRIGSVALVLGVKVMAAGTPANGSFETANFTGWSLSLPSNISNGGPLVPAGTAAIVSSWQGDGLTGPIFPVDGNSFAVLGSAAKDGLRAIKYTISPCPKAFISIVATRFLAGPLSITATGPPRIQLPLASLTVPASWFPTRGRKFRARRRWVPRLFPSKPPAPGLYGSGGRRLPALIRWNWQLQLEGIISWRVMVCLITWA